MNERKPMTAAPNPTKAWKDGLEREDMPLMRELIDLLCDITPEETVESIRYLEKKCENDAADAVSEDEKNLPPLPEGESAQMFIELCEWMFAERRRREERKPCGEEKASLTTHSSSDREKSVPKDSRTPAPPSNLPPLR